MFLLGLFHIINEYNTGIAYKNITVNTVDKVITTGCIHILQYLKYRHKPEIVCSFNGPLIAAKNGLFDILCWLGNYTTRETHYAAMNGHLPIVQWLCRKGYMINTFTANKVAARGHLHILKWLYDTYDVKCTELGAVRAAENGHIEVVQWLYESCNITCDWFVANAIVKHGNLQMLKELEKQQSYCDEVGYNIAAGKGYMDIVQWLHNKGLRNRYAIVNARQNGHENVAAWLNSH